jgi:hypothetical protein
MHLSLITSVYRGEAHLPAYGQHIQRVLAQLQSAGVSAEILVIANDPTTTERALLADLPIRLIETERETLYASWNRGLAAMQADVFGMWNIDDIRDGAALIEAYRRIQAGDTLVDSPMRVRQHVTTKTFLGTHTRFREYVRPSMIQETHVFSRKHCMNPFALIHRRLLDEVGLFDANFRVVGDLEWSGRAQKIAKIGVLKQAGGLFNLHGANLSSIGSTRQMIEENIIFLRRQQWDQVRPTPDADAMRDMWESWGNSGNISIPVETAARLWGETAKDAWDIWQAEHARRQRLSTWRRRIRTVTDRLHLTSPLTRLRRGL